MTAISFEDLQRLWVEQPVEGSIESPEKMLRRARVRENWRRWRDYLLFCACVVLLIPIFMMDRSPLTLVLGAVTTAFTAWPTWRRHRRANLAASIGGDRQTLLLGLRSLARGEIAYRVTFMITFFPFIGAALFMKWYAEAGGRIDLIDDVIALRHPLRLTMMVAALSAVFFWNFINLRKARREARGIRELFKAYSIEDAADGAS